MLSVLLSYLNQLIINFDDRLTTQFPFKISWDAVLHGTAVPVSALIIAVYTQVNLPLI